MREEWTYTFQMGEIENFDSRDRVLSEMRATRDELAAKVTERAAKLSSKRKSAARKLDKQVTKALQDLGMKGGSLSSRFERGALTLSGFDRVEFLRPVQLQKCDRTACPVINFIHRISTLRSARPRQRCHARSQLPG